MHCSSCVKRVENALSAVLGVRKAEVNLARKRASISYDPQVTQPAGLADAVKQLGYPAHPTSD
jgi:Cu+-exporting ATPase